MAKERVTILGATGSIGDSTLAVIRENNDFKVFAVTAFSNIRKLADLCREFKPTYAVVVDKKKKYQLESTVSEVKVLIGEDGLKFVASAEETDIVVSAIVGIAGLKPTFAAAKAGKKILLANKESLVTAGHLLINEVKKNNAKLIPVDSEHNAIFQILRSTKSLSREVYEIILTASGGPFRTKSLSELVDITPEQAYKHPSWNMGRKISVDSSTMVNKAREIIEAYWLFNIPLSSIKILIHPQSIIHSIVRYIDGSYIAQLGSPDMKIPIANALYYPNRARVRVAELDFLSLELNFMQACHKRFEALSIVFKNLKQKNYAANIVFNAANEKLTQAFLDKKINYLDIVRLNKKLVGALSFDNPQNIQQVFDIDHKTRVYLDSILR